jgi:sporulation protein YqfC
MNIINKTINYLNSNDIKIVIEKQTIKIINYLDITRFDEDVIVVKHSEGNIHINGQSLFIMKLLTKEVLIGGNIKTIEFR